MVPITSQRVPVTLPMTSCFNGRRLGARPASSNIFLLYPGNGGKLFRLIGIMRAASALACERLTPGLSRATAW